MLATTAAGFGFFLLFSSLAFLLQDLSSFQQDIFRELEEHNNLARKLWAEAPVRHKRCNCQFFGFRILYFLDRLVPVLLLLLPAVLPALLAVRELPERMVNPVWMGYQVIPDRQESFLSSRSLSTSAVSSAQPARQGNRALRDQLARQESLALKEILDSLGKIREQDQ